MDSPAANALDLTRERRERNRDVLAGGRTVDVLVVGGGVTGVGIALDAVTRGLTACLIEAEDLAFGTSRWSSKLIHGGLRYLAHGDIAVAWESAVERSHLMGTIAPHLIRPLPHVIPSFTDTPTGDRLLVRTGLTAADALRTAARTPRGLLGRARSLSAERVAELIPGIDRARLTGGALHWDGQVVDDARLVVALARTAARHRAGILTRTRALSVSGEGARVVDTPTGTEYEIGARQVIVAAGVWTDRLDPDTRLVASRGSHVLLRPEALGDPIAALTVAVPGERGRFAFALPTLDGPVIGGITDIPVPAPLPDVPSAPADEVAWILRQLSSALARELTSADAVGTYAGLRPLVAPPEGGNEGEHERSDDISRRHLVVRRDDGCIVVTGGKLTTYRRMAQDALDLADLPGSGPCVTSSTSAVGAQPYRTPPPPGIPLRLVRRFGAEAPRVASLAELDPKLLLPLAPGVHALGVEVVQAVRSEGALSVDDILDRRLRLSLIPEQCAAASARVAEIAAAVDPRMA